MCRGFRQEWGHDLSRLPRGVVVPTCLGIAKCLKYGIDLQDLVREASVTHEHLRCIKQDELRTLGLTSGSQVLTMQILILAGES